jgi:hypothetical protein
LVSSSNWLFILVVSVSLLFCSELILPIIRAVGGSGPCSARQQLHPINNLTS